MTTHIPDGRIEAEAVIRAAGGSVAEARVFRRLFGMDSVAAAPAGEASCQPFARLLDTLSARHDGAPPDTVIYVHGLPLQPSPHDPPARAPARSHRFLAGVTRHYRIDQYNCAGLFWALETARILLQAALSRAVAILAGDSHTGMPMSDRYAPGCTLMGDAFCGLVVDLGPGGTRLGEVVLHTHPEFAFGRNGTSAQMGGFFAAHSRLVHSALHEAGFDWAGAERLYPHNVNSMAWKMFCRDADVAVSRVALGLLPDVGHCYTTDPFLLLDAAASGGPPGAGTLLSVGMGGFVGACRFSNPERESPTC